MAIELKDAIDQFNAIDTGQAGLWNFYTVVSLGILTIIWTTEAGRRVPLRFFIGAYAVFCVGNGWLMHTNQVNMLAIANAIEDYAGANHAEVPNKLLPVIKTIHASPPFEMVALDVATSLAVIAAMWYGGKHREAAKARTT